MRRGCKKPIRIPLDLYNLLSQPPPPIRWRLLKMSKDIASLEQNENWQATAEQRNGKLVAIMRGQRGGRFEGKFHLYAEDWNAFKYPPPDGIAATPPDAIKSMLASGELTLLRGTEPQ